MATGIDFEKHLDEHTAAEVLIKLLRTGGHDVTEPVESGTSGLVDDLQLAHSIRDGRAILTDNYRDFEDLHDLLRIAGGRHAGILVVRRDNDSARDFTYRGIVNALRKLEFSNAAVANEYIILNHWL